MCKNYTEIEQEAPLTIGAHQKYVINHQKSTLKICLKSNNFVLVALVGVVLL